MDGSATTALATLLGAATGGLTSVLATWLTHQTQARAQWLEQDALRRQNLYMEFIEAAARSYGHERATSQRGPPKKKPAPDDPTVSIISARVIELASFVDATYVGTNNELGVPMVSTRGTLAVRKCRT